MKDAVDNLQHVDRFDKSHQNPASSQDAGAGILQLISQKVR